MKLDSLKLQLDKFQKDRNDKAPNGIQKTFEDGIKEIRLLEKQALNVGDIAPDFTLNNALGKTINLSCVLQNGLVVLTWYRGGWCPYCNIQLAYLQKYLPEFKNLGATLLALTPELPDKSLSTIEKNELAFEVLTDKDNEVAKQFHLTFKLNPQLIEIYNAFHKLENYTGNDSNELPIPATYVIDKNGIIRYAYINADYRQRAEPSEIINSLKLLS